MVKDRDFTIIARKVVEQAIGEHLDGSPLEPRVVHRKSDAAVLRGNARAKKLSAKRRRQIAKKAAKSRWSKS